MQGLMRILSLENLGKECTKQRSGKSKGCEVRASAWGGQAVGERPTDWHIVIKENSNGT